jgi:hypothetical protein
MLRALEREPRRLEHRHGDDSCLLHPELADGGDVRRLAGTNGSAQERVHRLCGRDVDVSGVDADVPRRDR